MVYAKKRNAESIFVIEIQAPAAFLGLHLIVHSAIDTVYAVYKFSSEISAK